MRIGIDLGGTTIKMGIVDGGRIYNPLIEPCAVDKTEKEIVDHIISMLRRTINTNIRGIGVGVPSVVDANRGIVYNAVNIPSWKKVYLKDILEKEFDVPVVVNNDCNCFAFGERYYGEGTASRNIVCVILGTGVGAGIIIEDKLYSGNNTGAGEIGSIPYLDKDYEHYCSGHFFKQKYKTTGLESHKRALLGDAEALKQWDEIGIHIGNLMNVIMYAYDPEVVVLGGNISRAFDLFADKMYESMNRFPYQETVRRLQIKISHNEDIGLLGAAALVP